MIPDETGAVWRKSSRSSNGNNCMEVATNLLGRGAVLVRDSKAPQDGFLAVKPDIWAAFVGGVRDGAFQR